MNPSMKPVEAYRDRIEAKLPTLLSNTLRFQRLVAGRIAGAAQHVASVLDQRTASTTSTAGDATAIVVSSARAARSRTVDAVAAAARRIARTATTEADRVVETATDEAGRFARTTSEEVDRVARDASDDVAGTIDVKNDARTTAHDGTVETDRATEPPLDDPDRTPTGKAYVEMTKRELYDVAVDLEIPGRSTMTKSELLAAIMKRA